MIHCKIKNNNEIQFKLKPFNINLFSFYYYNRLGWIRLFDIGIKFKDTNVHKLLYSERNKCNKVFQISKWYICYLPYKNNIFYYENSKY